MNKQVINTTCCLESLGTRYSDFQANFTYCLLCLQQMESIMVGRRWFTYHLMWYKLFLFFLLKFVPNITFGDVCCPRIWLRLVNFDGVTVRDFTQKLYTELFRHLFVVYSFLYTGRCVGCYFCLCNYYRVHIVVLDPRMK